MVKSGEKNSTKNKKKNTKCEIWKNATKNSKKSTKCEMWNTGLDFAETR